VAATIAAAQAPVGETYNVGGGESASVWDILAMLERLAGCKIRVAQQPPRPGDQRSTFADTTKIRSQLGWRPRTELQDGLALQWCWQKEELAVCSRLSPAAPAQLAPAASIVS
jgi:UDP-glucose 4-epimerase